MQAGSLCKQELLAPVFNRLEPIQSMILQLFLQPDFNQRLIRHITRVGCYLQRVEQVLRQPK